MNVKEFTVTINYKGNDITVLCNEFQVEDVPQIWACVQGKTRAQSKYFSFYKHSSTDIRWWHTLEEPKKEMAEKIHEALMNI
jgi:hypothetical protein